MSELREECYKCLNNRKCLGGADYGSFYCMMNRRLKMQNEDDSVYAHKFAIMQKQIDEKDKRIKELEEENYVQKVALLENSIPKQKVKEILIEIQEEYNKLDKEIDKQIKDKNKDYYKCKENIAIMQTLAYCRDKFEGLLEEK